jgi:hypothetical protein
MKSLQDMIDEVKLLGATSIKELRLERPDLYSLIHKRKLMPVIEKATNLSRERIASKTKYTAQSVLDFCKMHGITESRRLRVIDLNLYQRAMLRADIKEAMRANGIAIRNKKCGV